MTVGELASRAVEDLRLPGDAGGNRIAYELHLASSGRLLRKEETLPQESAERVQLLLVREVVAGDRVVGDIVIGAGLPMTVIEWASAGVVGQIAWSLVRGWWSTAQWRTGERQVVLTRAESEGFARMYLTDEVSDEGELVLLRQSHREVDSRDSNRRHCTLTEWTHVMFSTDHLYTVTMRLWSDERLPVVTALSALRVSWGHRIAQ